MTAAALLAGSASSTAQAQGADWAPSKPVRIIVPIVGSTNDVLARLIAPKPQEALGQPFVVENKGGAGGNIGANEVARAAPDGHTLLVGYNAPLAINVTLFDKMPYDPTKDLAPITLVVKAPQYLVVNPSTGITPLLAMWRRLAQLGASAELIYCARSRADAACLDDLQREATRPGARLRLTLRFDDETGGPPHLPSLLAASVDQAETAGQAAQGGGIHCYACGPGRMLDAFEAACAELGLAPGQVHLERFSAPVTHDEATGAVPAAAGSYQVELKRSGRVLDASTDAVLLDLLNAAGCDISHSCREGVCGSCEVRVLGGEVEHRDHILSRSERAANRCLMPCVSRGVAGGGAAGAGRLSPGADQRGGLKRPAGVESTGIAGCAGRQR